MRSLLLHTASGADGRCSYLNPVNYAFGATMENEFRHLQLECDAASIVPTNIAGLTQYPAGVGPNQVCTLQGAVAGQDYVEGSAYLASAFQYYVSNQWRNWGICLVFAVAFLAFQAWMIEIFKHGADAPAINVFRKEDKKTRALNKELQDNKAAFRRGEREQDLSDLIHTRKPFTWEKVRYTVPVSGGQKLLLDDVYGYVKPGELTALMGSSGAGKTTLLDVLANRKNIGVVEGDILINGRPLGIDFQRGTAYVEQLDVHEWTATIREAFRFSAYLRQPAHIPKAEKDQYVEDVIQLLELEDLADAMIGFPGFGLDVEARKRVTIGVELASKPQLLLFCDEPTSGLDGQSAFNIVRFLRKLAAAGQAILCTIHQPNALLFENFDRLLLLQRGGQTVYFGGIGKDSHILRDYLSRNGAECPPNANPAEYMLEAIGAGSRKRVGDKDWAERWVESPEFSQVKEEIQKLKAEALAKPDEASEGKGVTQYATPLWTQLQVVGERTFISFYRRPDYGLTRVIMHVAIALLVGLTFLNLNDSVGSLQYRVFAVFYVTVLPAIIISMVEPTYILARDTFVREASSKMYSEVVFAMTQLMAEMPYSIISAVCFYLLVRLPSVTPVLALVDTLPQWYFPMGFSKVPSRAGYRASHASRSPQLQLTRRCRVLLYPARRDLFRHAGPDGRRLVALHLHRRHVVRFAPPLALVRFLTRRSQQPIPARRSDRLLRCRCAATKHDLLLAQVRRRVFRAPVTILTVRPQLDVPARPVHTHHQRHGLDRAVPAAGRVPARRVLRVCASRGPDLRRVGRAVRQRRPGLLAGPGVDDKLPVLPLRDWCRVLQQLWHLVRRALARLGHLYRLHCLQHDCDARRGALSQVR